MQSLRCTSEKGCDAVLADIIKIKQPAAGTAPLLGIWLAEINSLEIHSGFIPIVFAGQ